MANNTQYDLLRIYIFEQAKYCCEYCRNQERFSTAPFELEHIYPTSKGGSDEKINLACSCPACNDHKFTKTQAFDSITRKFVPIFNPRTEIWSEHFCWEESYTIILGITPIGRATVNALKMNRVESVNLRKALVLYGEHPPT
jgi:hypothetical protein